MASPEEMAKLSVEVKQRTEDLQAFMRDLGSWQQDIEAKDKQLVNKKEKAPKDSDNGKKRLSNEKEKDSSQSVPPKLPKGERISSYDYDKWDKFNVDEALRDVDGREAAASKLGNDVDSAQRLQEAAVMKEKGNEHFKRGRFDQAIESYSKGIACDPRNAALVANRAMALLKKSRYEEAVRDCTVAVDLDPTYVKAFQRRGTARAKLGRLEEALKDFGKVLQLEPGDKLATAEVDRIKDLLAKREAVTPADKARSKAQAKEFGENLKQAFTKSLVAKPLVKARVKEEVLEPGQVLPISKAPAERSKRELKRVVIEEIGDVDEAAGSNRIRKTEEVKKASVGATETEDRLKPAADDRAKTASPSSKETKSAVPPQQVPKTFVQFASAWKCLNAEGRVKYLRRLKASDYPVIFKQSLDPTVLSQIVQSLHDLPVDCSDVLGHLTGLASIPRIATLAMLMSKEDEDALKGILSRCNAKTEAAILKPVLKAFPFLK